MLAVLYYVTKKDDWDMEREYELTLYAITQWPEYLGNVPQILDIFQSNPTIFVNFG